MQLVVNDGFVDSAPAFRVHRGWVSGQGSYHATSVEGVIGWPLIGQAGNLGHIDKHSPVVAQQDIATPESKATHRQESIQVSVVVVVAKEGTATLW